MTFSNSWSPLTLFCYLTLFAAVTEELYVPCISLGILLYFYLLNLASWRPLSSLQRPYLSASWGHPEIHGFDSPHYLTRVHDSYGTSCHFSVPISQTTSLALTIHAPKFRQLSITHWMCCYSLQLNPTQPECFGCPRTNYLIVFRDNIIFIDWEEFVYQCWGHVTLDFSLSSYVIGLHVCRVSSKWLPPSSSSFPSSLLFSYPDIK